ncbi:hypothetical protein F2Q69_00040315 [Brassica cretica]|uniref:3-hydroxyisobutyryl-CoA hydrolase n=1 Tax=Brassica cretica TaxID=69181 RepID=A0A8S9NS53_BRACR|nr:hypothetical protein F2Q69_00040315 [Brassica cretica]
MTRSIFSRSLGCSEEPRMKLCYPQVNHYPNAQWNNFATGRAFCAGGGDVSAVVNYVSNFEWFQNYSVHGRFRIAIENTVFDVHVDDSQVCSYHSKVFAFWHARDMGLFPDVGANISFRRVSLASQELGWMALRCWLVVLQLKLERKFSLELEIKICAIQKEQRTSVSYLSFRLFLYAREGTDGAGDWISATIQALKNASPASLKISVSSVMHHTFTYYELTVWGQCLKAVSIEWCVIDIRAVRLVAAGTGGSGSVNILRQLLFVSLTQEAASDVASERRVLRLTPIKPAWQPWRLEEMKDSMVERGRSKASTKGKLACFSNGGKAVKWRR